MQCFRETTQIIQEKGGLIKNSKAVYLKPVEKKIKNYGTHSQLIICIVIYEINKKLYLKFWFYHTSMCLVKYAQNKKL